MCKPISAIVTETSLHMFPELTNSHELLLKMLGVKATKNQHLKYVKVEYCPDKDEFYGDISKYVLRLDQDEAPVWWNDRKEAVEAELREIVTKHIVTDERECIVGNWWILCDKAHVQEVHNCNIFFMLDSSKINNIYNNSQVGIMRNNSQIGTMGDNSRVCTLHDNKPIRFDKREKK